MAREDARETVRLGIDLGSRHVRWSRAAAAASDPAVASRGAVPAFVGADGNGAVLVGAPAQLRRQTHPQDVLVSPHRALQRFPEAAMKPMFAAVRTLFQRAAADASGDDAASPVEVVLASQARTVREPVLVAQAAVAAGVRVVAHGARSTLALLAACSHGNVGEGLVLVVDAGETSLEVGLYEVGDDQLRARARRSVDDASAEAIDEAVRTAWLAQLPAEVRQAASTDAVLASMLRAECTHARKILVGARHVEVHPHWLATAFPRLRVGPWHLGRERFDQLAMPVVARALATCREVLGAGSQGIRSLDAVLCIGGASRLPCLREALRGFAELPVIAPSDGASLAADGGALLLHTLADPRFAGVADEPGLGSIAAPRALPHAVRAAARIRRSPTVPPPRPPQRATPIAGMGRVTPSRPMPGSRDAVTPPLTLRVRPSRLPTPVRPPFPTSPGKVVQLGVLSHGRFANPTTALAFALVPLHDTALAASLDPPPLAALLRLLEAQRASGRLHLFAPGAASAELVLSGGAVVPRHGDDARLAGCLRVPAGNYLWQPGEPDASGAPTCPLLALMARSLRQLATSFTRADVYHVLGPRLTLAPVLVAAQRDVVEGITTDGERRVLEARLQGHQTGRDLLTSGPLHDHELEGMLLILDTFGAVAWVERTNRTNTSPFGIGSAVCARAAAAAQQNHYELLDLHWSATPTEIADACDALAAELLADGPVATAHPVEAAFLLGCVRTARRTLLDPARRVAYRRAMYPRLDAEAIGNLLAHSATALRVQGDDGQAEEIEDLRREILSNAPLARGSHSEMPSGAEVVPLRR